METAPPVIDKSTWGPGPWQDEPDRLEFRHAGLPCLIVRNPHLGQLCGYAAVPPGHPLHGKSYDDADAGIEVHGGLTYARACHGDVCHAPDPGEPGDVWWFGFDCAHCWDLVPGVEAITKSIRSASLSLSDDLSSDVQKINALVQKINALVEAARARHEFPREEYRDMAYCRAETEHLAEQLAAAA